MIGQYLRRHRELSKGERANLHFHAGQMDAFAGDTRSAIKQFRESFLAKEPPTSPVRWNAYVAATIAFLKGDRHTLMHCRAIIARGPRYQGSVPNLDEVDSFLANPGKPYSAAYLRSR